MAEDIFESIANLEQRADEVVSKAKAQARELRKDVERKLKDLADELERDYGKQREEIEQTVAAKRAEILRSFEERMRAGLEKLDAVRREKVAPLVNHVIKAFLEHAHGD